MPDNEPKKLSITGTLTENKLTEQPDDYTFNVTYIGKRSIMDLCQLGESDGKSKFTADELYTAYNTLFTLAKREAFLGATVEFGFCTNMIRVNGPFVGPKPEFDPEVNSISMQHTTLESVRKEMEGITVIVGDVKNTQPTISRVIDVYTQSVNDKLTPGNILNGEGDRVKVAGSEGKTVGFFFINTETEEETAVPTTSISRNEPSSFSFLIPQLEDGTYYLEVATQWGGNSKQLLKEPRRTRFTYTLTVGDGGGNEDDGPTVQ